MFILSLLCCCASLRIETEVVIAQTRAMRVSRLRGAGDVTEVLLLRATIRGTPGLSTDVPRQNRQVREEPLSDAECY
jgi:hypothetical protein